jgi:hypothetical protein
MWIENTLIRPDDDPPGEWNPPEIPGKVEWSDNAKAQVSAEDGIALTTNYPHVVDANADDADGDENDAQPVADSGGDGGAGDDAQDEADGDSDQSRGDTGEVIATEEITVEPEPEGNADADADSNDETDSIDTDSNIQTDTDNEET